MGCHCSKDQVVDNVTTPAAHGKNTLATDLVRHFFVDDINTVFKFHEVLGKGAMGYVSEATMLSTGKNWAVKIVDMNNDVDRKALRNEINLLKRLQHPNIVRVTSSYEDKEKMYMVMQLCSGRELFDHLYRDKKKFTEQNVKETIRCLLFAVSYLHDNQIIHRDLKLENLLLDAENDGSSLILCDFGLSTFYKKGERQSKILGTLDYVAPEILEGDYTEKCDLWSVGVICYELLSGVSPFHGANRDATIMKILDGKLDFDSDIWKNDVSPMCIAFIKSLTQIDPDERFSAKEALQSNWFVEFKTNGSQRLDLKSEKVLVENLHSFAKSQKLKHLAMLTIATHCAHHHTVEDHVQDKLKIISELFRSMDSEGTGTLLKEEFVTAMAEIELTREEAVYIFSLVDQTKSGSINYIEFLAALLDQKNVDEKILREAFNILDSEKKGNISASGLRSVFPKSLNNSERKKLVQSADLNKNGQVNFEEFKQLFKETPPSLSVLTQQNGLIPPKSKSPKKSPKKSFLSPMKEHQKNNAGMLSDELKETDIKLENCSQDDDVVKSDYVEERTNNEAVETEVELKKIVDTSKMKSELEKNDVDKENIEIKTDNINPGDLSKEDADPVSKNQLENDDVLPLKVSG